MKRNTDRAEFAEARTIVPDALDVPRAISEPTVPILSEKRPTRSAYVTISNETPESATSGSETTPDESDIRLPESQTSRRSEVPSRGSKRRWGRPKSVRDLASQANQVATDLLNGEMDIEVARTYGTLARSVAQMMSIEVTRARFLKTEPILELETVDSIVVEAAEEG